MHLGILVLIIFIILRDYLFACFGGWYFYDLFFILIPKWLPKTSAANTLFVSLFDTFAALFRKGVFEGSLARFGSLLVRFGSLLFPWLV